MLTINKNQQFKEDDPNLNCNKFNYNNLTVFKPQTEYTNNIAIQQFIN